MEHRLDLTATLDATGVEKMMRTLRGLAGVRAAEVFAGSAQVHVQYDADLTSPQEISRCVARSGFPLRRDESRASQCCGSCGGH